MPEVALIPRSVLFGNPDRTAVRLSPDGSRLAWLAPLDGVLNVWVAPRDDPASARPVTRDAGRGVRTYLWAYTNRHILYLQDRNGDENWRLYGVDLASGSTRDLTPIEDVQTRIVEVSRRFPAEIVVGLNNRVPEWHDIHRLNIVTGALTLLLRNDRFAEVEVDEDYRLRYGSSIRPGGGADLFEYAAGAWRLWDTIPAEDAQGTALLGFDKSGRTLFMKDSRGRNTAAVTAVDTETKRATVLAADPRCDAANVARHPVERHIQAASFVYERKSWVVLDESIKPDLEYLGTIRDGDVEIVSRTLDDKIWVVLHLTDDGPGRFHLYDRARRSARFLFTDRRALEGLPLVRMRSAAIKSRDNLELVAYYSLPPGSDSDGDGIPDKPVPTVFLPHGGPWGRDHWGYNQRHQWLANRGYAALCVNFRASAGFGKALLNAGDREWGGKIMEDQVDAVQWAISKGIADAGRVAVFGGSFGGYSALAGLTLYPELFACGVDMVGPSNLITLLESMPPFWKPMVELFAARVGDHRTGEGRALLARHSPITYAERIRRPLLIAHGANDPRVKRAESDQIVGAMQAKNIPVTYVLYPDEGHGLARPENSISFHAIAESFLAEHLGGRCEPVGADFNGSSLQVLAGAEEVRSG